MKASTHQAFGLTFGLTVLITVPWAVFAVNNLEQALIFLGSVWLGSLLPDLDTPRSKLGRKLWFLSVPLFILFGHRKFTHSLTFLILVWAAARMLTEAMSWPTVYAWGLALGIVSHLTGDILTSRGVPLFFPLLRHHITLGSGFRTGGYRERAIAWLLTIINVLLVFLLGTGQWHEWLR